MKAEVGSTLTRVRSAGSERPPGAFEVRATNQWINGSENRSRIKGFFGAGGEDESRTDAFEFTNGEPPVLLGGNEGANPVEFLLHALAGWVTATTALHVAARGVQVERLSPEPVGTIDRCRAIWREPGASRDFAKRFIALASIAGGSHACSRVYLPDPAKRGQIARAGSN